MSNRLKQFFMQFQFYKMPLDEEFLARYLNSKERVLFDRLAKVEQNHSILVAKALQDKKIMENHEDLIKVGLFHDIGKSIRPLSVGEKGLCVITHKLLGRKITRLGTFNPVDSYLFHGERGAEILRRHEIFNENPLFYEVIKSHHWNINRIVNQKESKLILFYHSMLKQADDEY